MHASLRVMIGRLADSMVSVVLGLGCSMRRAESARPVTARAGHAAPA